MSAPLKICAVSFLNARPLFWSLQDRPPTDAEGTPLFEVQEALPAECARMLEAGECDVALVPVAAYARNPDWEVVPEVGIACRGAVQTVLLLADQPLESVQRVFLDGASMSSALLLRILLADRGLDPELIPVAHGEGMARVSGTDAALVIGDAAFGAERFEHTLDLGAQWFAMTGLPMVFAFWAARPGALTGAHVAALQAARDRGLKHAEALARTYREERLAAGKPAESESHYANYLRRSIRYGLDAYEREGLVEYLARARESALIEIPGLDDEDEVHVHFAGEQEADVVAAARARRGEPFDLERLLARAADGGRLDFAEGLYVLENASMADLGEAADKRRQALHPESVVTYIIDRNVNYTNVCTARCKFCNFYTPPPRKDAPVRDDHPGYVHSREVLAQKFRETEELGGVQILLQGGLNPELGIEYYEDLFRWTKENFSLALHALSPTEVIHIARQEDMTVRDVLVRLRAAGLDSIPGGGAEVLHDDIRNRISPFKNSTQEWLDVMREAHDLGMKTTCTMVFGFQETSEHLVYHLERLRSLQDETGGFTAFIVWPFQADGTRLKLRDDTSSWRYLRLQAFARLYLDNVPNIQVSWPTLGPEVGEIALRFGANDFGSVMIEENVVSQAGAHFMLTAEQIEHHIRQAGFTPARRNMRYQRLS